MSFYKRHTNPNLNYFCVGWYRANCMQMLSYKSFLFKYVWTLAGKKCHSGWFIGYYFIECVFIVQKWKKKILSSSSIFACILRPLSMNRVGLRTSLETNQAGSCWSWDNSLTKIDLCKIFKRVHFISDIRNSTHEIIQILIQDHAQFHFG
jgi:hypothetical protein